MESILATQYPLFPPRFCKQLVPASARSGKEAMLALGQASATRPQPVLEESLQLSGGGQLRCHV